MTGELPPSAANAALEALAAGLGYRFTKIELLRDALTHSSLLQGRGAKALTACYERLEFLGDRVLGLIVAEMLFDAFPNEAEGALARRHAALVRRETLAKVAESIELGSHLRLSRGEDEGGGRANPTLLADACEAVIGALYADGGLAPAAAFIRGHWRKLMAEDLTPPKDAKTALQEWAQGRGKPLPKYETVAMEGPPHSPSFLIEARVEGVESVSARGASKRAAEQAAAAAMLEKVKS